MPSTAANATSRSPEGGERGRIITGKAEESVITMFCHISVTKGRRVVVDPLERPVGLPLHTRHGVNGVE